MPGESCSMLRLMLLKYQRESLLPTSRLNPLYSAAVSRNFLRYSSGPISPVMKLVVRFPLEGASTLMFLGSR